MTTQTKVERLRRPLTLVVLGLLAAAALVVLLLACVLWVPRWLYPSLTDADLQGVSDATQAQQLTDARLQLQNDARTTLLQGLGALIVLTGAGVGAGVTLRQVRATHEGQVTDRYTKAIDQLDNKNPLAVRLGGLYALERIARDSPADRATIAEVLSAYARAAPRPGPPEHRPKVKNLPDADSASTRAEDFERSLTIRAPDIQAAVTILGRWTQRLGEPPPVVDLHNADLQHAYLSAAQLQRAILINAQLQDANLIGAQLQRARLHGAQLQGARLLGAQLQRAILIDAQLQGAILGFAQLQGAQLHGAQLQDANLLGAQASWETRWPEGWDQARASEAGVTFVEDE